MYRRRILVTFWLASSVLAITFRGVANHHAHSPGAPSRTAAVPRDLDEVAAEVDQAFAGLRPHDTPAALPQASDLALVRRLSLGLQGTIPSLDELRRFETLPHDQRWNHWVEDVLSDRRWADYVAERLARAYVGVDDGPFLLFRRRRFVAWLADALHSETPYDVIVHRMLSDSGLWTDSPATNFVTAAWLDESSRFDDKELTVRVARGLLGVRLDCAQCHDHPFDERWKQDDFLGLTAFFRATKPTLTGVTDQQNDARRAVDRVDPATDSLEARVPFCADLLPTQGPYRLRLALWVTDPGNHAFARAAVNRLWAIVCGRPLMDPIDDIPLDDTVHPALDVLAQDFAAHGFDVKRLIRLVARTDTFSRASALAVSNNGAAMDSRTTRNSPPPAAARDDHRDGSTDERFIGNEPQVDGEGKPSATAEASWASFPVTRLRPEQIGGSIIQAGCLTPIGAGDPLAVRISRGESLREFVRRFGDRGEEEFSPLRPAVRQSLLMLNGDLISEVTCSSTWHNSIARVAPLAPNDTSAIEDAFLLVLTRRPTAEERAYFAHQLAACDGEARLQRLQDICWAMINSTEFTWNH